MGNRNSTFVSQLMGDIIFALYYIFFPALSLQHYTSVQSFVQLYPIRNVSRIGWQIIVS